MIEAFCTYINVKEENQNDIEGLIQVLVENNFSPLIRTMLNSIYEMASFEPDYVLDDILIESHSYAFRSGKELIGEIFLKNNAVYVLNPLEEVIETSVFSYNCCSDDLDNFCKIIEEYLKKDIVKTEIKWKNRDLSIVRRIRKPYNDLSRKKIKPSFKKPVYNETDLEIVNCLKVDKVRQFIIKLSKLEKMIKKDALRDMEEQILKNLINSRLIKEEYLLKCRKDHHTICTIPSKENLKEESMQTFKCDCGRSLSEEHLQTIYSLTPRCKELINGSLWMSIWITELLRENGTILIR